MIFKLTGKLTAIIGRSVVLLGFIFVGAGIVVFMTMTSRQRSLPFYVDVLWRFRVSEIEVSDLEATKLVV